MPPRTACRISLSVAAFRSASTRTSSAIALGTTTTPSSSPTTQSPGSMRTAPIVIGIWVAVLGVDFAVLCALLAFALHFVPNVGAVLAAVPAMVLAFVQYDLSKSLAVCLGYLVVGFVLGNLAEPALLGRRLNLSPLAVFLSLVFWGWLWGAIGMFLSVPLTMAIKILLERSRGWRWAARLLDGAPAPDAEPSTAPTAEAAPATERV